MSNDPPEFLDVEDDEQRQNRIGALLYRLNTSSSTTLVPPEPALRIGRESVRGPVEPPAELLARVKAFLPAISASNKALSQMRPEDIDIEKLQGVENEYIEMNLGLGVFEAKRPPNSQSRSTSPSDSHSDSPSPESESDSDSCRSGSEEDLESDSSSSKDDSDSESQSGSSVDMRSFFSRPIRPLPRRTLQQTKGGGSRSRT